MPVKHINVLPNPLATVIFHYSPTQDYVPEFTSMIHANSAEEEVRYLRERYKAHPEALKDVLILTPSSRVAERKGEYPDIEVRPIALFCFRTKGISLEIPDGRDWKPEYVHAANQSDHA